MNAFCILDDHYFGGMDWGSKADNQQHHGLDTPPIYDPSNINTKVLSISRFIKYLCNFLFKVALFYGDNDWLAAEDDVAWLAFQLPNMAERYKNPWVGWNHFDFLYAIDIDEYQNNHLLEVLKKYPIL